MFIAATISLFESQTEEGVRNGLEIIEMVEMKRERGKNRGGEVSLVTGSVVCGKMRGPNLGQGRVSGRE